MSGAGRMFSESLPYVLLSSLLMLQVPPEFYCMKFGESSLICHRTESPENSFIRQLFVDNYDEVLGVRQRYEFDQIRTLVP